MMLHLLTIIAIVACVDIVFGMATVIVPASSNCRNQAVLTCKSIDCNLGYRFLKDGFDIYTNTGPQSGADPAKYSATVISISQVQLTMMNIQLSDSGKYACQCGFEDTSAYETMQYICKATTSDAAITTEKKLSITVDSLFPQPSRVNTSLTNPTSLLSGINKCGPSSLLASHYKCTWVSTESLPDGNYGYSMTVTTGTEAAQVTGTFKIVTPISPTISNVMVIFNNREVLRGIEDTPLTLQCVSSGGNPAPILAWYRGNTSTSPLAQSTALDTVQRSDGTYTVSLNHSFSPSRKDDMTKFLCRLFYSGATFGASPNPSPASALMYLDLKPGNVAVSQTAEAVSRGSVTLHCSSNNSRPASSITWSYKGQTFTPINTSTLDPTSETYTVESILQRPVNATDNGLTATCRVTHTILTEALIGAVRVIVKFGPSKGSTTISGNLQTAATGSNHIRLNCTSGSSNPASIITWYNESDVMSNVDNYKEWSGDNNGVITSNILTITPTRYMDGDRITCRSDNSYDSDDKHVDLDILYSPLIHPLLNITSTEGEPGVPLTCLASSKPPANFTWSKGLTVLANGTGTIRENSFSYVIPRLERTDAGIYQCQAGNSVGRSSDLKNMYLIVKYPPAVTVSTTSNLTSCTVKCTAEGNPHSYNYQNWEQIWPGYGPVAAIPFTGTTLTFADFTYERSGVYVCGASNGVAVYGTDVRFITGNATVLIEAPPVLTDPHPDGTLVPVAGSLGHNTSFEIKYWSNVDGSFVRCYKIVKSSRSPYSSCFVMQTNTKVILRVYNHAVIETGTLAVIKIHISSQDDMTAYDVVVLNRIGESVLGIIIVPQGPPEAPILTGNFSITPGQVILTVLPGFHGGFNQTLVVQISTDLTTWTNKASANTWQEDRPLNIVLSDLKSSTFHYVRVFAYNIKGRSNSSTVLNITTAEDPPTTSPPTSDALIIGAAVGSTCALLVVAVVLVVVWKKRKAGCMISKNGNRRDHAKDQDNTDSVVECAMYVSARNVQQGTSKGDGYSTSQKKGRPDSAADVYAVVSKTRKGKGKAPASTSEDPEGGKKKGAAGNPTQGMPEVSQLAETHFNNTKKTTCNRPTRSTQNVRNDGLIYADVDFGSNLKYDEIHGLDDVTLYVEIDFTKTAEQLPVSEEEIH